MAKFVWLILTHQKEACVMSMLAYWRERVDGEIHVLYGGMKSTFDKLPYENKHFVHNEDLVTRDHPRERQSYAKVFQVAASEINFNDADFVYFTEFDQIPMVGNVAEKLAKKMVEADLLCYGLKRVDGSNHPHWLNHRSEEGFWKTVDRANSRMNDEVVLSCYGFGQCWRLGAFLAVANIRQSSSVYLELWIPTMANRLGYRVRLFDRDKKWNLPMGEQDLRDAEILTERPWFIHPVKKMWNV